MTLALVFALLCSGIQQNTAAGDDLARELGLANAAYETFDNPTALEHFLKALEQAPENHEALWKAAQAYADVGKAFEESNKDKAKELYQLGLRVAQKAVELYPDSAEAHFVLAMCLGRLALFEGGRTKIRLSKEVKEEAERAIELNPNHDGAYHLLGRWNYSIATLGWLLKGFADLIYGGVPPGASLEEAARLFAKAVELDGTKPVHRLEYGRALIELERYSEAREQLEKCLELPRVQWEDPAHQKEAAHLLETIE